MGGCGWSGRGQGAVWCCAVFVRVSVCAFRTPPCVPLTTLACLKHAASLKAHTEAFLVAHTGMRTTHSHISQHTSADKSHQKHNAAHVTHTTCMNPHPVQQADLHYSYRCYFPEYVIRITVQLQLKSAKGDAIRIT